MRWAMHEADIGGEEMHLFTNMIFTWRRNEAIPRALVAELKLLNKDARDDFYKDANWLIKLLDDMHKEAEGL